MTRRIRHRQRGVTLVEALVAIALFGLVASGAASLAMASILRTTENRHATHALTIAQETLEQFRGMPYDDVAVSTTTVVRQGQTFTVTAEVDDDDPGPGMKHIEVRVAWIGPEGARSHAIETIFTTLVD